MIECANEEGIIHAVEALKSGKCIGLPTETVYGLAGNGLDPLAVARIFEIKQRPSFDPLILHVAEEYDLDRVVHSIPDSAHKLMQAFWPGPLTLVLPRQTTVPDLVTSGLETVALRCPRHPVAQEVLRRFDGPLAAPSANPFGRLSPTTALAVDAELGDRIALTLDGGPCEKGVESSILDCSSAQPRLLRPGALPLELLRDVMGEIVVPESNPVVAPGMLEHHYAPRTPLYVLSGTLDETGDLPGNTGLLAFGGNRLPGAAIVKELSQVGDLAEAAFHLFSYMRELDLSGVERIVAFEVPMDGLGRAINDRLKKASAGRVSWTGSAWSFVDR